MVAAASGVRKNPAAHDTDNEWAGEKASASPDPEVAALAGGTLKDDAGQWLWAQHKKRDAQKHAAVKPAGGKTVIGTERDTAAGKTAKKAVPSEEGKGLETDAAAAATTDATKSAGASAETALADADVKATGAALMQGTEEPKHVPAAANDDATAAGREGGATKGTETGAGKGTNPTGGQDGTVDNADNAGAKKRVHSGKKAAAKGNKSAAAGKKPAAKGNGADVAMGTKTQNEQKQKKHDAAGTKVANGTKSADQRRAEYKAAQLPYGVIAPAIRNRPRGIQWLVQETGYAKPALCALENQLAECYSVQGDTEVRRRWPSLFQRTWPCFLCMG